MRRCHSLERFTFFCSFRCSETGVRLTGSRCVRLLPSPSVVLLIWVSRLYLFTAARTLLRLHPPHPRPLPPHPFSKTHTGSEFKIDTRCKCHFPARLSLRQPFPANQNPEPDRVWAALSPVRTGRGCRAHSRSSSLGCWSNSTTPPSPAGSVLLSLPLFLCRVSDHLSYTAVSFPWLLEREDEPACCFSSLTVAKPRARAPSEAGETQPEFKCTPDTQLNSVRCFSSSETQLSLSYAFICIMHLCVCPCFLLFLSCPLPRRRERAHAIAFAASVHTLTGRFRINELKWSLIATSVGGKMRRIRFSHARRWIFTVSFQRRNKLRLVGYMRIMQEHSNRNKERDFFLQYLQK